MLSGYFIIWFVFCLILVVHADIFLFSLQAAYRFKEAARVTDKPKETEGTLLFPTPLLVSLVLMIIFRF